MKENNAVSTKLIYESQRIRPFHILSLLFVLIFILSNIAAAKMALVAEKNIFSGVLYFPLIYVINDIITEVYGFNASRKTIWAAAIINIACAVLLYFAVLLPDAPDIENNLHFNKIFELSAQILIASITSFVLGEYVNSIVLAKLKLKFTGRFFAFRAIFSTLLACIVETLIFVTIVFSRTHSKESILEFSLTLIGIKIMYEILFIPFTSVIVRYLKDTEHIDFYDYKTKFNLFPF